MPWGAPDGGFFPPTHAVLPNLLGLRGCHSRDGGGALKGFPATPWAQGREEAGGWQAGWRLFLLVDFGQGAGPGSGCGSPGLGAGHSGQMPADPPG